MAWHETQCVVNSSFPCEPVAESWLPESWPLADVADFLPAQLNSINEIAENVQK